MTYLWQRCGLQGGYGKILNDSKDGAVMRDISIPPERSGLVVKYFDRQTSSERKSLPTGILIGSAAIKDESVITGAIKRLLGELPKRRA